MGTGNNGVTRLPSIAGHIQIQHENYSGGSGGYTNKNVTLAAGNHTVVVGAGASGDHNITCSAGGNSSVDGTANIGYGGGGAKALKDSHYVGAAGTGTTSNGNAGNYSTCSFSSSSNYSGTTSGGASVYGGYGAGGSVVYSSNTRSFTSGGNGYVKIVVR